MNRNLFLLIALFCFSVASAQSPKCAFEFLFKIKPGMQKAAVLDSVSKVVAASQIQSTIEKLPPYKGTGGDSITKEIVVYLVEKPVCFYGLQTKFQLEFADDKLFKVYISTEFGREYFQELTANFNDLRKVIRSQWPFEKATRLLSANLHGSGYEFTKTKKVTTKTEKIIVQYVDPDLKNSKAKYLLEVLWANLKNTRMEGSNF